MYSYNIKFNSFTSRIRFELHGSEDQLFFELNGSPVFPTVSSAGENLWEVRHRFRLGDVFGAYVRLPITQPYQVTKNNEQDAINRALACLKQTKLSLDEVTEAVPFTLFDTYEYILNILTRDDPRKLFIVPATDVPAIETFATQSNRDNPRGFSVGGGVPYYILYTGKANGNILHMVDNTNLVSVSDIARITTKFQNFDIFTYTPTESYRIDEVDFAVDDVDEISPSLAIPKRDLLITPRYEDRVSGSIINPRFQVNDFGINDLESYLVRIGTSVKRYTGQLPTFEIPINDGSSSFSIDIITKHDWNSDGIEPARPEIGEYQSPGAVWRKTKRAETGYWVTSYSLPAFSLTTAQTFIWRLYD